MKREPKTEVIFVKTGQESCETSPKGGLAHGYNDVRLDQGSRARKLDQLAEKYPQLAAA